MSIINSIKELFTTEQVDYTTLINNGAILIDVRTPSEFQIGHASGSKNIPLQEFENHINTFKNKEVVVVCRSGGRASQAVSMLKKNGIKAHNAGAWQNVK